MRVTQGTFSYLPDLTDEQIKAQVQYALDNDWAMSVEYTDDPHPRNSLLGDVGIADVRPARPRRRLVCSRCAPAARHIPSRYIKVNAYDRALGRQTTALSFIVKRPPTSRASASSAGGADRVGPVHAAPVRRGPGAGSATRTRTRQPNGAHP